MIDERVAQRIRELPDRPGIYIFRGARKKALYVGKAKSLRKRAVAYLRDPQDERLQRMLAEARDLDFLVVDSEAEALALENNWIKNKQPRYNILLRDDKTYPYLKLTAGEYPRGGASSSCGALAASPPWRKRAATSFASPGPHGGPSAAQR